MADELRKEKLAKLREKRKASEVGENNDVEILNNTEENKVKFRNYQPRDKTLIGAKEEDNELDNNNNNINKDNISNEKISEVPKSSSQLSAELIKNELKSLESKDINIVHKKSNWDLKQHLSKKLDKLKKQTKKVIVEVLREKLTLENDSENMVE